MEKKRILISDDELEILEIYKDLFGSLKCDIVCVQHGLDAFLKAQSENFDLLITDLVMPKVSGAELISEVRKNPKYSKMPIVVVSGNLNLEISNKLNAFENVTLFQKPFDENVLLQKVKSLLLIP